MIDADFVHAITDLEAGRVRDKEVDGVPMSTASYKDIRPKLPEPAPLALHTLDGMVDYLAADPDGIVAAEDVALALHVSSPVEVRLIGELRGVFRQRFTYAKAVHEVSPFVFGQWYGHEEFVIRLGSMFEDAGDRAKVIQLAGTVTSEQGVKTEDDGITQTVHVRQGVTLIGKEKLPNPVELAPFRTFYELEQPAGKYLLRARQEKTGIEWALFEADGGAWKQTCREAACRYLMESLGVISEELAASVAVIR